MGFPASSAADATMRCHHPAGGRALAPTAGHRSPTAGRRNDDPAGSLWPQPTLLLRNVL